MSDRDDRRFRTLDELQEEYNEKDHNVKDELKEILQNLKEQVFSMWGALIMFMLFSAVLGAIVR